MPKQYLDSNCENNYAIAIHELFKPPFNDSTRTCNNTSGDKKDFPFKTGDLIADRYLVVREVSYGMLGLLYQVIDTNLTERKLDEKNFYLKMLHPEWSSNAEAKKRFKDELDSCIDLVYSPKIRIEHLGYNQNLYYYLTGPSLKECLIAREGTFSPLFTIKEIKSVMVSLLDTLHYVHQYTIHRHISPDTIIILGTFPDISIRLLDYDACSTLNPTPIPQNPFETGYYLYMAPEQIESPFSADPRTDLFSVGVILYEMVTGERPAGAFKMVSEYCSDDYRPLDNIIKKALSPKADQRYSSAEELSHYIDQALTEIEAANEKKKASINSLADKGQKTEKQTIIDLNKTTRRANKENILERKKIRAVLHDPNILHVLRMPLLAIVAALLFLTGCGYFLLPGNMAKKQTENVTNEARQHTIMEIEPTTGSRRTWKTSRNNLEISGTLSGTQLEKSLRKRSPFSEMSIRIEGLPNGAVNKKTTDQKQNDNILSETLDPLPRSPEPVVTMSHLTVSPSPPDAEINILNINPTDKPILELFNIEVLAPGNEPLTRWLDLAADENLDIEFDPTKNPKSTLPLNFKMD